MSRSAPRLGAGTRARLPVGGRARVIDGIPRYGGRLGRVAEYNGTEVGVEFAGHERVWFRAGELVAAPDDSPADAGRDRARRDRRAE